MTESDKHTSLLRFNYGHKKFNSISHSGMYYKHFTIEIYDHNDSDMYYKTMILTNLALARSVNYDRKVCCKLNRTFTIVNYNRKKFNSTSPRSAVQSALFQTTCNPGNN